LVDEAEPLGERQVAELGNIVARWARLVVGDEPSKSSMSLGRATGAGAGSPTRELPKGEGEGTAACAWVSVGSMPARKMAAIDARKGLILFTEHGLMTGVAFSSWRLARRTASGDLALLSVLSAHLGGQLERFRPGRPGGSPPPGTPGYILSLDMETRCLPLSL
jgi:hypothetical protein